VVIRLTRIVRAHDADRLSGSARSVHMAGGGVRRARFVGRLLVARRVSVPPWDGAGPLLA
jgi:hypothetical protein